MSELRITHRQKPSQSFLRKNWLYIIEALLFLIFIGGIVYWFLMGSSKLPVLDRAYNFALVNTDGKEYKLSDSDGKVRLLTFIYTRCTSTCPVTTYNMAVMQKDLKQKNQFGNDVEFISITLDPTHDTVPVMKTYANQYGADPNGWQFFTGNSNTVQDVLKHYGIYADLSNPDAIVHSQEELLIDKNGNIRKRYGAAMDRSEIEKDIKSLL
jgi:protein SCO1